MTPLGSSRPDSLEGRTFVGTVVVNDDSTSADSKKRQRLKVTVLGVLDPEDGYTNDLLPWAAPHSAFGDWGSTWGEVDIPSVGAKVNVIFQDGRKDHPLWFPAHVDSDPPSVLQTNYPNRRGRVLKNGAFYYVDEQSGEMEYKLANGFRVYVDGAGNHRMEIPENTVVIVGGNATVQVAGNASVSVEGTTSVHSGGSVSVSTDASATVTAATQVSITAPNIALNG